MAKPLSFKQKLPGILVCCFAAFGGFLFGYDTGTISGNIAMNSWLRRFGTFSPTLTDFQYYIPSSTKSVVVSIMAVGEFSGALLSSPVADSIGRRFGIVLGCLVLSISVAMQTGAQELGLFIAGRVIGGVGIGLVSGIIPMFQSECAPKWIRGTVVAGYQWFITIGILIANIVNNATKDFSDDSAFRIPIGIQIVFAAILAFGMYFLPESPRWLVKNGDNAGARKALARLNAADADSAELDVEFKEITDAFEAEIALGESSYADCFKNNDRKVRLRTLTGIAIQGFQQLTGVNFIFYYGTTFFKQAGYTDSFIISMITSSINMVTTIPSFYLIEKIGRRKLLFWGAVVMCACEFIVAIIGVGAGTANHSAQTILVVFVCVYIAAFASTWGPIAWVVLNEINPLNIRAKAVSMGTASNWFWNFLIGFVTPYLVDSGVGDANLGAKVFFIWGTTCFFCAVFAHFFVYETKGLSLEEVDNLYINHTARESVTVALKRQSDEETKNVGEFVPSN
ncbi:hypothetical protein HK100_000210 [Physocladia obscura]|uniref:Major facilitator superfamily (MFS) profile domain-containing protein n=1 Tax=Physocladia obscura TaxID=109957 RepID=A0AAD5XH42_9FUNG|nr:hypothetical protein HK100_000210 [Physocladia obscura]